MRKVLTQRKRKEGDLIRQVPDELQIYFVNLRLILNYQDAIKVRNINVYFNVADLVCSQN
jgi:hypothetical protein